MRLYFVCPDNKRRIAIFAAHLYSAGALALTPVLLGLAALLSAGAGVVVAAAAAVVVLLAALSAAAGAIVSQHNETKKVRKVQSRTDESALPVLAGAAPKEKAPAAAAGAAALEPERISKHSDYI